MLTVRRWSTGPTEKVPAIQEETKSIQSPEIEECQGSGTTAACSQILPSAPPLRLLQETQGNLGEAVRFRGKSSTCQRRESSPGGLVVRMLGFTPVVRVQLLARKLKSC